MKRERRMRLKITNKESDKSLVVIRRPDEGGNIYGKDDFGAAVICYTF